jgi:pimeloyl-ACP methyl ester carboxylesterase
MNKIAIQAADKLNITANLYEGEPVESPVLILFHQVGFSRGEYVETAEYFHKQVFTCIAPDLRSGGEVNGTANETYKAAVAAGKPTNNTDATQDIEAVIAFVHKKYPTSKTVILGSSYSSSLALIMGVKYGDILTAVISFSRGEYFKLENKSIAAWAKELRVPVFISSAKDELDSWAAIFKAIPSANKIGFKPIGPGIHGSRNLWLSNANHQEYRSALEEFIHSLALTYIPEK